MSAPVRVSAVSFINARPLVCGLDEERALFDVQYDLPAACAARLHAGEVDLGLIPAIEYLAGDYHLVPDMAIGSDGPILSVALFAAVPIRQVQRIAVDTSSRTSVALTRVLCATLWHIDPVFVPVRPVLAEMLAEADAALVIGDPALDIDPGAHGVEKLDLGEAWRQLTGLPFVYAAWAGRPGVLGPPHLRALGRARDRGLAAVDDLAREYGGPGGERAGAIRSYLRHNLRYTFGPRERAGLERFFALAAEVQYAPLVKPLRFF